MITGISSKRRVSKILCSKYNLPCYICFYLFNLLYSTQPQRLFLHQYFTNSIAVSVDISIFVLFLQQSAGAQQQSVQVGQQRLQAQFAVSACFVYFIFSEISFCSSKSKNKFKRTSFNLKFKFLYFLEHLVL